MRDFLRRHRRKIVVVTAVGAGLYYAWAYAKSKLRELTDKASDERVARDNLKRRFRQNQQDATLNVVGFLPELAEKILDALKVEAVTAELQAQKSVRSFDPSDDTASIRSGFSEITHSQLGASAPGMQGRRSKLELWNEVKIMSLTRIFSLYYAIALLVIFTRVQLNLIGRESYVSSVMSIVIPSSSSGGGGGFGMSQSQSMPQIQLRDEGEEYRQTFDTPLNRQYMTFVWWLLNRGWQPLVHRVRAAVEQVFGRLEVREDVTLAQFRLLTSRVRSIVEFNGDGDDHHNWLPYLLPDDAADELEVLLQGGAFEDDAEMVEPGISPELRAVLDETREELDSQETALLISRCLDVALQGLVETRLRDALKSRDRTRVANVLPVVTREAHLVAHAGLDDESDDGDDGAARSSHAGRRGTSLAGYSLSSTADLAGAGGGRVGPGPSPLGGSGGGGAGGAGRGMGSADAVTSNDYLRGINNLHELDGLAARLFTKFEPLEAAAAAAAARAEQ